MEQQGMETAQQEGERRKTEMQDVQQKDAQSATSVQSGYRTLACSVHCSLLFSEICGTKGKKKDTPKRASMGRGRPESTVETPDQHDLSPGTQVNTSGEESG